ncbi:hypothetical protein OESDEN_06580 [Oesophagostomum dentatum]|uniref:Uncharacterized protein n=1 Tax=Oesophagostomum dentatum TaxID=61180 RepID=A0A0B1TCE3_OESDE|nr:hypothetical protein OESDEN_06580 [Oesophagostomum dentatum]
MVYNFTSDREDAVKKRVSEVFGYDTTNECVSGNVDILKLPILYMILHQTLPVFPAYTIILLLRRGIIRKLSAANAMSENSRHLHSQLLKVPQYAMKNVV